MLASPCLPMISRPRRILPHLLHNLPASRHLHNHIFDAWPMYKHMRTAKFSPCAQHACTPVFKVVADNKAHTFQIITTAGLQIVKGHLYREHPPAMRTAAG